MFEIVQVEKSPRDLRRVLLTTGGMYLLLYTAWLVWGRDNVSERLLVSSLALIFTSLISLSTALWVWQQLKAHRLHMAWGCLATGMILWTLGDILRLVHNLIISKPLVSGLMDIFLLAGSVPVWIGLLLYPRLQRPYFGRLTLFLDITIVTAATVTLVWLVGLQPGSAALPIRAPGFPAAPAFPLVDLVSLLLIITIFLLSDVQYLPAPLGWAALGLTAYTLADLSYSSLYLNNSYPGGMPFDAGWAAGDLLLAMAAISELVQTHQIEKFPSGIRSLLGSMQRLLPLIATLVLGWYTVFIWQLNGQLNQPGLWVTLVLSLGLIARQGILAGESELQKYANLVNSVAEPAFVCDNHGHLRLTNPALISITGYLTPQELLGRPIQRILHPAVETGKILTQGLTAGWSGEAFLRCKDNRLIPISLALRPLQAQRGGRLALAGTAHDLSEQKNQQAALQAAYEQIAADRAELENLNFRLEQRVAEKTADLTIALQQLEQQNLSLQQLDQLKSDFVSLVSHELRAPLTTISGGIELLLAPSQNLSDHPRRNLTLVQAEIKRLNRFVETILDLSALDAGRMPLYPAPLMLNSLIDSFREQAANLAGIERVNWNVPGDLPPILVDEQALDSILFHLLDNAFKYAPEGEINIRAEKDRDGVQIQVEDCGPGIPPEALPMLFERFFRVDTADARSIYGHGLGLYIVSRLVQAMNGHIRAENRPEAGARFTIWLPLVDGKEGEDAS